MHRVNNENTMGMIALPVSSPDRGHAPSNDVIRHYKHRLASNGDANDCGRSIFRSQHQSQYFLSPVGAHGQGAAWTHSKATESASLEPISDSNIGSDNNNLLFRPTCIARTSDNGIHIDGELWRFVKPLHTLLQFHADMAMHRMDMTEIPVGKSTCQ